MTCLRTGRAIDGDKVLKALPRHLWAQVDSIRDTRRPPGRRLTLRTQNNGGIWLLGRHERRPHSRQRAIASLERDFLTAPQSLHNLDRLFELWHAVLAGQV